MTRARKTLATPLIGCVGHDCAVCRAQAKLAKSRDGKNAAENAYPQGSHSCGLTKRELLAAMAMQGMLRYDDSEVADGDLRKFADVIGHYAVVYADALLKKLDATPAKGSSQP